MAFVQSFKKGSLIGIVYFFTYTQTMKYHGCLQQKGNQIQYFSFPMNLMIICLSLALLLMRGAQCAESSNQNQPQYTMVRATNTNQTCLQKCDYNQLCVLECERKIQDANQIKLIIGISSGVFGLVGIIFAIILVACLCPCMFCPCHFYQDLKRSFNNTDSTQCSTEKWQQQKDNLLQLLSLPNQLLQLTFVRNGQKFYSKITSKVIKQQEALYRTKIQLEGTDSIYGDWQGYGYIVMKKKGLKLWLYKSYKKNTIIAKIDKVKGKNKQETEEYKKKQKAQELNSKKNFLVYKSGHINLERGVIKGTWSLFHDYYKGKHEEQTGSWQMRRMHDINKLIERVESGMPSSSQSTLTCAL